MALLILAMVLAAGITHAAEQSTARTRARWDEARRRAEERGAARERARQERVRTAKSRWHAAVAAGPRHLLWWFYAVGWITVGTAAALGAGVVGAYSGAVSGGRSGYRVGLEAGRRGAHYREAWRQWRRETPRPHVKLAKCRRCGYWVRSEQLDERGLCQDCAAEVSGPSAASTAEDVTHDPPAGNQWHAWAASSTPCSRCLGPIDPGSLRSQNKDRPLCAACSLLEEVRRSRASDHPCRCMRCGRTADFQELDRAGWCRRCTRHHGAGGTDGHAAAPGAQTSGEEQQQPHRIHVDAERADVHEEETEQQRGITSTMAELMPANSTVSATGEGYADTVNTLAQLTTLLTRAHEEVTNLGDMLTANSLDAETLNQINELADLLDTAAPMADRLHKHVENRHGGVADAMASAGGSGNVADKGWYDQY
ncbi:hypothetical protein [Actinopolyspora halophila]|uniref:hypothetical protein n=1 Tax=Actinopolyspora halophila TaxID=1850 RepID=UPI000361380C|nr:hypothetical protein [Actinopolyspora halophila]